MLFSFTRFYSRGHPRWHPGKKVIKDFKLAVIMLAINYTLFRRYGDLGDMGMFLKCFCCDIVLSAGGVQNSKKSRKKSLESFSNSLLIKYSAAFCFLG